MAFKVVARPALPSTLAGEVLTRFGAQLVEVPLFTEEDIVKNAADADAVLVGPTEPFTPKVIRTLSKCKILSRTGIGFNNIDVDEATRQGIPVAIVLDASVHEVSDHVLAFLLAFSRKLFPLTRGMRMGLWTSGSQEMIRLRGQIFRLNQQTLGIVGVGRIGTRVAQKARAFGMRVLGCDPYLSAQEIQERGAEKVDFDPLLREADFVSLNTPLTPETKNLFGLEEIRKMKPTAYLINTARGGIINEKDLYQALMERSIAGAGLDVTDPEPPLLDNPLFHLDNVLTTGHSAFYSETSVQELYQKAAAAIIMAFKGEWPPFLANPQVKGKNNCRLF
ncbi:MAG: C-terminal binding protein [Deltaproteobacteria bacterium]|nr:C-terminal binding protein [Deltaproteobacteria bacterium]